MVAHSQCFRSEAGSAGRDTAGMLRQHQFEKVEMVSITDARGRARPNMTRMTRWPRRAGRAGPALPHHRAVRPAIWAFSARITHDLEVWLPGQNTYREISSASAIAGIFRPAG
jgi:seryl-tRNA synthetase